MSKLEAFALSSLPIFSLNKSEVEEAFELRLEYLKDGERIPIMLCSDHALEYLPDYGIPSKEKTFFSVDIREADIILDRKRKELGANAIVSVTYAGPYCRRISNKTILARGYPVKIIG